MIGPIASPSPQQGGARTLNLSLISHTNVGKTTLVRTLLARDVGEVRDAAHVTDVATGYLMLQAGDDSLMLWDTPGFGDTIRLLKRLRLAGNPIGWFLSQVWDRFRDRPLWSSQQAVLNARDEADVILYLVNAGENPEDAGYVQPELEILAWIGKPVLLLLNQVGPPREDGRLDEERWETALSEGPGGEVVRGALTLDAFARCWVQEGALLRLVEIVVAPEKRDLVRRLAAAWAEKNLQRYRQAMHVLAEHIAIAATDREPVGARDWRDKARGALLSLKDEQPPEARRAMAELAERLQADVRGSTEALIRLHNLSGRAAKEVLRRLGRDYAATAPAREGFSALLGGVASGAAGGLAADLAAGGLTLGGGMIVGGILGAIGAGTAARGYNVLQGEKGESVRWGEDFFLGLVRSALLRYLSVAHFGRGRGDWEEGEHPPYWQTAVATAVEAERDALRRCWDRGRAEKPDALTGSLEEILKRCAGRILSEFYPEAIEVLKVEAKQAVETEVGDGEHDLGTAPAARV